MSDVTGLSSKPPLILASASPRRVALLAQIGIVPDQIVPADIDESCVRGELPSVYAKRMAIEKTQTIAAKYPDAFVIGADTVVACGRRILPKAEDEQTAKSCMTLLMGRSHRVYGGLALAVPQDKIRAKVSYSHVAMRRLDAGELSDYLAFGDWDGKAGGYAIQGQAARYITKIQGSYSQIMGLDIHHISQMLKSVGLLP